MNRALFQLSPAPEFVFVDGDRLLVREYPAEAIVKGDQSVASIAAASILAKVARDSWMDNLATQFSGYGFETNKGYGTGAHQSALVKLGPTPQHRRTFAPLRQQLALPARTYAAIDRPYR
jgi:ribonuclease HII